MTEQRSRIPSARGAARGHDSAAEQRLRDILDTAHDWIWELDAGGRFVFCCEAVQGILGYTARELIDTHISAYVHPGDRASIDRLLGSLGKDRPAASGFAARWRHRDGDTRWLEGNVVVIAHADGRTLGFRGTHRDITERRRQEEEIARLTRRLEMRSGSPGTASVSDRGRRDVSARATEDTTRSLAYFDPLTGLADRALYCERLDERLRSKHGPFAVVAFEVHDLSVVNDRFGRHVGDLLLQRFAERLKSQTADDSRLGYLGGGTFALVVPQLGTTEESAAGFLQSPLFSAEFLIEGRSLRVSFRFGVARSERDGDDGGMLVQRAEAALAEAKRAGETFLQYELSMHSEITERLALEHRLRAALDEQQFVLYYQPELDLATGRVCGVEALLRWRDPEGGVSLPAEFLMVLESSGLIDPVGRWVLQQAVRDCLRWRTLGIAPMRVAVNVSAFQIRRRAFVQQALEEVEKLADGSWGIDLEITETGLLQDLDTTRCKLEELRRAGVRIAIDDFGTGYSSLALLPKLPVDVLKIDRSFIDGLPDDPASVTLVSSIIGLARAFNLTAVAEGVEAAGQLEVLRSLGCHRSQGYLHGRPVPAGELQKLLRSAARG